MENTTIAKKEDKGGTWILNLIGIIFFSLLAWWSYTSITKFQTHGGYLSLPRPLMLFYDLAGKWGVVGFWLAIVAYNLIRGIIRIIKAE